MPVIVTHDLTKTFGKNRGVTGVNLSVQEGDFFGFIGPNGAGKSTTIRLLFNFIFPTGGSADIFGLDCVRESEKIKTMVGYVPSEVNYYKEMSVKGLLSYAASFHKNADTAKLKRLTDFLKLICLKKSASCRSATAKRSRLSRRCCTARSCSYLTSRQTGLTP